MKFACKKSVFRQDILFLFFAWIYRIGLDTIYIQCISPLFGYSNLTYEPESWSIAWSWGIFTLFSILVLPYRKRDSVISIAVLFFYFMGVIPFTSFIACKSQPVDFVLWQVLYWLLIFCLLRGSRVIHVPALRKTGFWLGLIALILALIVVFISGYYTHFRLNFGLSNVYDLRMEARDFNLPTVLAYLWAPAANVLPIILIAFLQKKKWLLSFLLMFVIFLNFSINGSKSALFKLFFCLFLYYFLRKKDLLGMVHYLFVLLVAFTLLEWWFFDSNFISSLIIRRVFFVPALLNSLYYDYIMKHGPLYYGEKTTEIDFNIGDEYFGREEMRANNGMFTDAFMNLGHAGCIIYPFIYAFFFKLCDSAFQGKNKQVVFFAGLLIVTTLLSTVFTTALLTHGIFLLCLIIYLFPREDKNKYYLSV